MHLVMSISYLVVRRDPSARSSASMVMAWAGQIYPGSAYRNRIVDRYSYSLAELAGNASLLTRGVSSEGVLASESGGDGALRRVSSCFGPGGYVKLSGIPSRRGSRWCSYSHQHPSAPKILFLDSNGVNVRWSEELLEQHIHAPRHLRHEEKLAHAVQGALLIPRPLHLSARSEVGGGRSLGRRVSSLLGDKESRGHEGAGGELAAREHGRRGLQGRGHLRLTRGGRTTGETRRRAIDGEVNWVGFGLRAEGEGLT